MNQIKLTPPELTSSSGRLYGQLTTDNQSFTLPFQIRKFGSDTFNSIQTELLSAVINQYRIVWVTKGYGHFKSIQSSRTFRDNYAYMISPGQHYDLRPQTSIEGFSILFTEEFLCRSGIEVSHAIQLANCDIFGEVQIDSEMQKQMDLIIDNMFKEFTNSYSLKSEILGGLLKILLLYLSRKVVLEPRSYTAKNRLEKQFMTLLDSGFTVKKRVVDYASDLAVTPNHLNSVVKRITGFTASYHIQQRIVSEAKKRALYSLKSMKEISYELGFDDTAHFSKFFKNYSGVCFSEYKHQTERLEASFYE